MKKVLGLAMLLAVAVPAITPTSTKATHSSDCYGCCDRCGCNALGRVLAAPATLGLSLFTLGCPDCNCGCCESCGSCC